MQPKRFSGTASEPYWYWLGKAEPTAGLLYDYGCYAQRLEDAATLAAAMLETRGGRNAPDPGGAYRVLMDVLTETKAKP